MQENSKINMFYKDIKLNDIPIDIEMHFCYVIFGTPVSNRLFSSLSGSYVIFLLLESLAVCWLYGLPKFADDIQMMFGQRFSWVQQYLKFTWLCVVPIFCLVSVRFSLFWYFTAKLMMFYYYQNTENSV